MKKRVLVLGSTGMLGHVLTNLILSKKQFDVFDLSFRKQLRKETIIQDVSDFKSLELIIKDINPDTIVNCVGVLVRESNINQERAILINSYFPYWLSGVMKQMSGQVIHISTDCVFSGNSGPYNTWDEKDAKDFYGKTKSLGELINEQDLTLRTSIIGPELKSNGEGLLHWFLTQHNQISGFGNVFWSGVTTIQLAEVILKAIDNRTTGLYQITNGEQISKFGLLNLLNNIFSTGITIKEDKEKKINKSLIRSDSFLNDGIPGYTRMVEDLKFYIDHNRDLYPDYKYQITING